MRSGSGLALARISHDAAVGGPRSRPDQAAPPRMAACVTAVRARSGASRREIAFGGSTSLRLFSLHSLQPGRGRPPLNDEHRALFVEVGMHNGGDVGMEPITV